MPSFFRDVLDAMTELVVSILTALTILAILYIISYAFIGGLPQ